MNYRNGLAYRSGGIYRAPAGPLYILPGGIAPPPLTGPQAEREVPTPWVSFRVRYATPDGIAPGAVPNHTITHYTQYTDLAGRGPHTWASGTPRIEYKVRYIEPPFLTTSIFGTPLIAFIQVIEPTGWGESSWVSEDARLDINLQRLLHHSGAADPAGYGIAGVVNQYHLIVPEGWTSGELNFPIVFNYNQHLLVQPYQGTNSDPTGWANYAPFVENTIRTLGPGGWMSSKFSVIGNWIYNTAVPITPAGLDATIWGPDTFIAHRIRYVASSGWDSFYSTNYAVIYNDARVLAPAGISPISAVGTPSQILNLDRTFAHYFPYGGETFGTAFIADRIRYVASGLFYAVPSGFPEVRLNPYPIAPAGIAPPPSSAATVYEHFTTFKPFSVNVHPVPWVGEPFVQNRNKTITTYPSDQSQYGRPQIFNYIQSITVPAGPQTIWGPIVISRRTRTLFVAPISVPVFSTIHQIRNDSPDPPSVQRTEPGSIYIGSDSNVGIVPAPTTRLATIYPAGIDAAGYGTPTLTFNTIELTQGIFNLVQVGEPTLSAVQYLYPKTIPWPASDYAGSSDLNNSKPRVTPHTIYAPSSDQATPQANTNNPASFVPHVITAPDADGTYSLGHGWPWFGRPTVSNYYRTIGPVPNHEGSSAPLGPATRYGTPEIENRLRYIYPTPVRAGYFGWVVFLNVPQYVDLNPFSDGIPPLNAFGGLTVAPPPMYVQPEILPVGSILTLWGQARVELFDREVRPTGIPHRGNPEQNLTNPWGTALVGYPRVYTLGGYDMTLWGNTWVSHYTRSFEFQGWLSSTLPDEDLGSFALRMRVTQRNIPGGIPSIRSTTKFGATVVSNSTRTIIGRGVAARDVGTPSTSMLIFVTGWDSALFGDIDEWEAGKIKPYGPDMSEYGIPRMARGVWVPGYSGGYTPNPAVARPIYVSGLPPIGFDGPSVTDEFGCNTRVITPLPVLSTQTTPTPKIFIGGYLLVFGIYEGAVPTPGTEWPNSLFASGTAPLNTFGDHDIFNYDAHTDPIEEDL